MAVNLDKNPPCALPRQKAKRIFMPRVQPGDESLRRTARRRHERPRPGGSWAKAVLMSEGVPSKPPPRHCRRWYRHEVDRSLADKGRSAANPGSWSAGRPKPLNQAIEPRPPAAAAAMPAGSALLDRVRKSHVGGWGRANPSAHIYGAAGPRESFFAASSSRYSRQYFSRLRPSSNK